MIGEEARRKDGSDMKGLAETIGSRKPVIAMCHLQALPEDPYYDQASGMEGVFENGVDRERVERLMERVSRVRENCG